MTGSWWSVFGATFVAVFVAELGDKTQLAAFGLAASQRRPWAVFLAASLALVLASALAVLAGRLLSKHVDPRWLHYGGAALFLALGLFMLVRGPEVPELPGAPPASAAPLDEPDPGPGAPGPGERD